MGLMSIVHRFHVDLTPRRRGGGSRDAGLKPGATNAEKKADPSPPFANAATGFGMTGEGQRGGKRDSSLRRPTDGYKPLAPPDDAGLKARRYKCREKADPSPPFP